MKAKLFTYSSKNLSNTQRSILSKRINGYLDKSNKARYTYKREGIITKVPHIKVTNKTFIVGVKEFSLISRIVKWYGAKVKWWDIEVKRI